MEKKGKEFSESEKFINRMQALTMAQVIFKEDAASGRFLNVTIFSIIEKLAKDPVPNVKFNVAQCLDMMHSKLLPQNQQKA
jgi:hypothetical protein